MSATVFKFCIHIEDNQVCYCKQNQGAEIYFCLLFLFFPFSISHSNVMNMEIFVKYILRGTRNLSLVLIRFRLFDENGKNNVA